MIIDKIENSNIYFGISERMKVALNYIQKTDFSSVESGRHEIDGDRIFALVDEYETKNADENFLEAHQNYIDVQFMVEGKERVGFTTLKTQNAIKSYNSEQDFALFKENYSTILLSKGMFAIFFPDDLHMPGLKIEKSAKVKKVIVKVKI